MMYEKNERRINKYEFCKDSGAGCVNPNDLVAESKISTNF